MKRRHVCELVVVMATMWQSFAFAGDTTFQVSTNAFGTKGEKAFTFSYQSIHSGHEVQEINDEILARWPEMQAVVDKSGMTQALVIAKVNESKSAPDYLAPHVLRFQKAASGRWVQFSLCRENDADQKQQSDLKEKQ
jgi:hypothetical protein